MNNNKDDLSNRRTSGEGTGLLHGSATTTTHDDVDVDDVGFTMVDDACRHDGDQEQSFTTSASATPTVTTTVNPDNYQGGVSIAGDKRLKVRRFSRNHRKKPEVTGRIHRRKRNERRLRWNHNVDTSRK